MTTTELRLQINAPREIVYRALIDERAVGTWMVPDGMTSKIHTFNAREGGSFRISLTYDSPDQTGKSGDNVDTYHGRFEKLVPNEEVVQVMEFESADPKMQGEMTVTFRLADRDHGTELVATHKNVPAGVSAADNELGWKISLGKLKTMVEAQRHFGR